MVFLGKLRFAWKWAKRFKNDGFFIFWNILSLVSHGNVLKWKIIYISWQTPYLPRLKSLVLKLKTKILSVNQIAESLNCIISRKKWETKLTFCIKMNITVSGGHSQAFLKVLKTRNLQYLCNISRKKGGMKLNFHQHHTFLQVDTINLGYCQSCPKIPKITSS